MVSIVSLNATDRLLWRKTIHDDASQWLQFMKNTCLSPDTARLIPFCHFITPEIESARMKKGGFDARFYLCVANEAEMEYCSSDNAEVFSLMWVSPNEALSLLVGGEHIYYVLIRVYKYRITFYLFLWHTILGNISMAPPQVE